MKNFIKVLVVITILETGVYWYYNNLFSNQVSVTTAQPVKAKEAPKPSGPNIELIAKEKAKLVSVSENGQFAAYVNENNQLHIINLQTKKQVLDVTGKDNIVYLTWIRSDSLFIGEKSNNRSLILKTIQVGTQKQRTITTFNQVSPASTFQSISFSPYTNDVYTLIGNDTARKMYHFDTNGTMSLVPLRLSYIQNPAMLSSQNVLFFEDNWNNIWMNENKTSKKIETNATLLSAYGDTVYFGILDNAGEVTSIYDYTNGVKHKIYDLPTPVQGNQILVKDDGNILYAKDGQYYDKDLKKSYPLPAGSTVFVENHKLIATTQDKAYVINDSQQ